MSRVPTRSVGATMPAGYRLLAQPVSRPPAMGELTVMGQQRRQDLLTYLLRRFAAERVEELVKEAAST